MLMHMPELLLIAGTGRNSGKTTLACKIIKEISQFVAVVAIKITPHFHENSTNGKIILERADLVIVEELDATFLKDSCLMLKAGAMKSFFVMAKDENLGEAFQVIRQFISTGVAIICESGGSRKWIKPGLFLMLNHSDNTSLKPGGEVLKQVADQLITFNGREIDFDYKKITFSENKWKIVNGK